MPERDRTELVEAFAAAWRAKDLDALMELMSDEPVFRASVGPEPGASFVGREAVRRGFEQFLGAAGTPEPESANEELLVARDFAVTRWALRFAAAEDSAAEVRGCDVFEFDGDRISLKDTYRKVAQPSTR